MKPLKAGSETYIRIEVSDGRLVPALLFNPGEGVKITLKNPSGVTVVNAVAMTNEATGVYSYRHQTAVSDPLGPWTAEFKAVDGATTVLTVAVMIFLLV